jgi:hypothetical protein
MSENFVEVTQKIVHYVVVKPAPDRDGIYLKVSEVPGRSLKVQGTMQDPGVTDVIRSFNVPVESMSDLNSLIPRDVAVLSVVSQGRSTTKAAKEVLVQSLSGLAKDIGLVLIGKTKNPDPDLAAKTADFLKWLGIEEK